jgi:threonine dehydratase
MELNDIQKAETVLKEVVLHTPLSFNMNLSEQYDANIFLKREDLQVVRSYKIRGAYNKISSLTDEEKTHGIVCASAGNHAQGVAYSCKLLQLYGKIYMPKTTPKQKIKQVKLFGKTYVEVVLIGDTFDDAYHAALQDATQNKKCFIHPFNDEKVMAGQGTVGLEILADIKTNIDYLFLPIGGGGLASGVSTVFKARRPK